MKYSNSRINGEEILLEAHIPLPPSVNNMYGLTCRSGKPHKYLYPPVAKYKRDMQMLLLATYRKRLHELTCKPHEEYVALYTEIIFPDRRKRDISNLHKILDDCLHPFIIKDDSLIAHHNDTLLGFSKTKSGLNLILTTWSEEITEIVHSPWKF